VDDELRQYCSEKAHASINTSGCVDDACTDEGAIRTDFVDPRRKLEPVEWGDLVGTAAGGTDNNTLTRTAATGEPPMFDAGAASQQTVTTGDAWVEFTVVATDKTRAVGF